jgi:hypothetical protein
MALRGFPPSNLISPSIRIAEKDLSFIASDQSGHRAGLVGFASKGPINIPTAIFSVRGLHTTFGQAHPQTGDPYLIYAGEQYLSVANELYVVRVADTAPASNESASTASIDVLTSGGAVQIIGNVAVNSGWSFAKDTFFRWRLNGVLSSKVLVILADGNRPSPNTGLTYAAQDLVDTLNEQLSSSEDGIEFYLSGTGTGAFLGVRSTYAYGTNSSIELVSVTNSLYGATSVVGMGTLMTQATLTGSLNQYPAGSVVSPGTYNFSSFGSGDLNLQIVIDGTDNVLIDGVVQTVVLTSASQSISTIVTTINTAITNGLIPGGFVASASGNALRLKTLHSGRDAKLVVKSVSTAYTLLGLSSTTVSGTSPTCTTGVGSTYTCGIVSGSVNGAGTVCFTVEADSPGIDGNSTQLVITNSIEDGSFTIEVYSFGAQVESWGGLVKDPTSNYYVETYISQVSQYIRVVDNTATLAVPANATSASPLTLVGGFDGIPANPDDQDAALIGSITAMTGLQALSDPEQVDIDIIAIPGHTATSVILALIDFAETRGDCFAIVDSPFGLTAREIVQWQNGTHPLNDVRFDSNYAALYYPWVKIRDGFNRADVWVPPSVCVMATYAYSDSLKAPWYAPAGTTRGIVSGCLDVFSRPTRDERDLMYGNANAINPIVQFSDLDAFLIWGQKTLQRRPTALDRVNVRRMMMYVEKRIQKNCKSILFEPHTELLRENFVKIAKATLDLVQAQQGLTDYRIQCDTELNTPDVIDRNELRARIGIQPARAAEFIFIEFSIHRTGSFGETAANF